MGWSIPGNASRVSHRVQTWKPRGARRPHAVDLEHGVGSGIVRDSPLDRKEGVLLLNLQLVKTEKVFSV